MNNLLEIKRTDNNPTAKIVKFLGGGVKNAEIRFEKGVYEFTSEGCFQGKFFPLNNKSGEKKVIFPALNAENLTIDGGGAEFVFTDRCFPFVVSNCKGVTLKNFSVDFSFPRYCESEIVKSDEKSFAVKIDRKKYAYSVSESGCIAFSTGKDEKISSENKIFFLQPYKQNSPAYLAAGEFSYGITGRCVNVLTCFAKRRGENEVEFVYKNGSPVQIYPEKSKLIVSFDEDRENDVIFIETSENVRLENVDIYRGAGMGIVAQLTKNIELYNVNVKKKTGRSELYSITADGFHFVNCMGRLDIKNCEISDTVDDSLNIHGAYMLAEQSGDNGALLAYGHYEQSGVNLFRTGDLACVYNGQTHAEKGIFRVENSVFRQDGKLRVKGIAGARKGDRVSNKTAAFETVNIENCTFKNSPHVRISDGGKIFVKNCLFVGVAYPVYVNDLFDYYYESGLLDELTAENNTFENFDCPFFCGIEGETAAQVRHGKIVLKNNVFRGNSREKMRIGKVKSFESAGNVFENGATPDFEVEQ